MSRPRWQLAIDPPPPIGVQLQNKLRAGLGGTILVVSDSTGTNTGITSGEEWPRLMAAFFGAAYPNLRVDFTAWVDGGSTYPAATTLQAGSGSGGTLTIYNCSVGSKHTHYFMAPYFDAMIAAVQPDLAFLALGHNEGAAATAEPFWRDDLLAMAEWMTNALPLADFVLTTQNPRTDSGATNQAARRPVTMYVAAMRGYAVIDTYSLFLTSTGATNTALLNADGIHPTAVGHTRIMAAVADRLSFQAGVMPVGRNPSSFAVPVTNYLLNGDFASFASPPTLTSWTATQSTLTKDTTSANYESPNGYSVKQTQASAATSYIEQSITGAALRPLLGQWVTFAARVRMAAGSNGNVGRVQMRTTGAASNPSQNSIALAMGFDGFKWATTSFRCPADAGTLTCRVYCENGSTGTGVMNVDRAVLVRGPLPRDIR